MTKDQRFGIFFLFMCLAQVMFVLHFSNSPDSQVNAIISGVMAIANLLLGAYLLIKN